MRGIFKVLALSAISLNFLSANAHAETFLNRCFPKIDFAKATIACTLQADSGEVVFQLLQGRAVNVSGRSNYGRVNKALEVKKISHLPPRLSDVGALDESVEFLAVSSMGSFVATIDIPCNQMAYASVGFNKSSDDNGLPTEHIAACKIQ